MESSSIRTRRFKVRASRLSGRGIPDVDPPNRKRGRQSGDQKPATPSTLCRLPPELLTMICKLTPNNRDDGYALSSLSQTCRSLHAIAEPVLFRSTSLHADLDKYPCSRLVGLAGSPHLCARIASMTIFGVSLYSRPELETILKQTANLKTLTLEEPHGMITLPDVLCDGNPAFSLDRFMGEPPADDNPVNSRFITEFLPAQRKMRHLSLTWAGDAPSLPPASFPGLRILEMAPSPLAVSIAQGNDIQYFRQAPGGTPETIAALYAALPSLRVLCISGTWDRCIVPYITHVECLELRNHGLSGPEILSLDEAATSLRCIRCWKADAEYSTEKANIIFKRVPSLEWVEQYVNPRSVRNQFLRWYRGRELPTLLEWVNWKGAWLDNWDTGCEFLDESFSLESR